MENTHPYRSGGIAQLGICTDKSRFERLKFQGKGQLEGIQGLQVMLQNQLSRSADEVARKLSYDEFAQDIVGELGKSILHR